MPSCWANVSQDEIVIGSSQGFLQIENFNTPQVLIGQRYRGAESKAGLVNSGNQEVRNQSHFLQLVLSFI